MKAITIRGIDPELEERLKNTAAKHGKSVNQLTLDIIKESLGCQKGKKFTRRYDDLDLLFGQWSQEEFHAIQGEIDENRQVDPELWK